MRGPEEWPSRGSNPADRIRLTGPAAFFVNKLGLLTENRAETSPQVDRRGRDAIYLDGNVCFLATTAGGNLAV